MLQGKTHRLLIVWNQYRSYNRRFFELLNSVNNLDLKVVWVRGFRDDDMPPEDFLSRLDYKIVGLEGVRVGNYKFADLVNLASILYRYIDKSDFVLTSTQAPVHSKVAFALSRLLGKKIFILVEQWRELRSAPFLNKLFAGIGFFMLRHCDKVFVHGVNQKNFVKSKGVKGSKISTLPHISNDLSKWPITKPRLRSNLGLDGKKIILYFGRITPRKGLDILINAFKEVRKHIPNAVLIVCGGVDINFHDFRDYADEENNYENICKRLASQFAEGDIIFMGYIKPNDKHNYFSAADIFVHPHANYKDQHEGWGLVINEAASMGLPIITTERVGSAPDLVINGFNGFIVKSGDINELSEKIVELLKNEQKMKQFSLNSRVMFEKHHNEKLIVQTIMRAVERDN